MTSEWKPGDMLCWERGFTLVSTGDEKLWVPSELVKIQLEKEKSLDKEKWQTIHKSDNRTGGKETS